MKKNMIILLICLSIFILICLATFILMLYKSKDITNKFKLRIRESSWSGWTPNYEPQEVTKEYDVVLGEEYSINSGKFTFLIEEINNDNIIIKTSKSFSDKEEGIDLRSKKTKFTIYLDEEIKLTTQTMDAGEIYYLTLLK